MISVVIEIFRFYGNREESGWIFREDILEGVTLELNFVGWVRVC